MRRLLAPPLVAALVAALGVSAAHAQYPGQIAAHSLIGNNTGSPAPAVPVLISALTINVGGVTCTLGAGCGSATANTVLAAPDGSSGTPTFRALVGADLPAPSASTLGGIESFVQQPHKYLSSISTLGTPVATQPVCADLSDAGNLCTSSSGTSGHTIPYLDGTNTWSGVQTFGTVLGSQNAQSGITYTLAAADCGKTVYFTNASAITLTVPNSIGANCSVAVEQAGTGQVTITAGAGATVVSAHSYTKTFGQWALVGLYVDSNAGGSAAHYVLSGDGAP